MIKAENGTKAKREKESFVTVKLNLSPATHKILSRLPTAIFDLQIYVIKRKYDIFQNPLYVWEAIKLCINSKKQFPSWILEYLNEAGNTLLAEAQTGTIKGNPETIRNALKFNLGLGKSPFTNYLTTETYIKVALATPKIIKKIKAGHIKKLRTQSYNDIIASEMIVSASVVKHIRKDKKIKQMLGI